VSVKDLVVNTEVRNWIVLVPWVGIFLELGMSSCLGLAFNGVASWDGLYLSSNIPLLSTVSCFAIGTSKCVTGMRVNDIMVNTEVWNCVVFVPWVLVLLELVWSSCLSLAFN